jgi:hypothetical protein
MTDFNSTTPSAPVPPLDLKESWMVDSPWHKENTPPAGVPSRSFCWPEALDKAAAWGYQQALPERQELAAVLLSLAHFCGASPLDGALDMEQLAHAWAERLRGGGGNV